MQACYEMPVPVLDKNFENIRWAHPYECENGTMTTLYHAVRTCKTCGKQFIDTFGPKTYYVISNCRECRVKNAELRAEKRKHKPARKRSRRPMHFS